MIYIVGFMVILWNLMGFTLWLFNIAVGKWTMKIDD